MMDLPGHVHYPGKMFNAGTSDAGGDTVALIIDLSEEEYQKFATEKVHPRLIKNKENTSEDTLKPSTQKETMESKHLVAIFVLTSSVSLAAILIRRKTHKPLN